VPDVRLNLDTTALGLEHEWVVDRARFARQCQQCGRMVEESIIRDLGSLILREPCDVKTRRFEQHLSVITQRLLRAGGREVPKEHVAAVPARKRKIEF